MHQAKSAIKDNSSFSENTTAGKGVLVTEART